MVPGMGPSAGRLFNSAIGASSVQARASAARLFTDAARVRPSVSNDWQITDFCQHAEQDPSVIFTDEAIEETTAELLGPGYRVEEPDDGEDANEVMMAAEQHMMTRNPLHGYMPLLTNMMRDVNIQKAVTTHMIQNPDFKRYIQAAVAQPQPQPLAIEWSAAEQDAEVPGGLQGLIEDLAQKMRAAGESALLTAKGIRNSLGRILIHLGASLHAFLGQPFSKTPLEEDMTEEDMDEKAEIVGQALATVAIAILSIVFLKRAQLVSL